MKLWLTATAALAAMLATNAPARAEKIDFTKQIQPILASTCYKCHGQKDKGELYLNKKASILKGGERAEDGELTVVAGDPSKSLLYHLISLPADDPDIMPPKGDPLTKEQQELIKQWITEGADFGSWVESDPGGEEKIADPLPEVPVAPAAALDRLNQAGALAMPLAKDTNTINVDFRAVAADIGDSHLELLAPVANQVVWLGLSRTKVTDSGLAHLKPLKNLRRLHLENTAITDAGIPHIAVLTELRYLNLYGTQVTDAGIKQLATLTKLQSIYLWQTKATDAGVAELQKALPNVRIDTGYKPAPPPAAAAGAEGAPINTVCPMSGKAVDATKFVIHEGQKIGFCCDKCPAEFQKNPAENAKKVKEFKAPAAAPAPAAAAAPAPVAEAPKPINAKCPVSGKDIDPAQFSKVQEQVVGFCCVKCKAKFDAKPEEFLAKVENFKPAK